MEHVFWTVTLVPGEGWTCTRWVKVANLWPEPIVEYDRLMRAELVDVLDTETSAVLLFGIRCGATPT